ncbi:Cobalamin synthesis protein cobW C-terminal domain-containing protein [Lacrimispora sphenoides]|jgi:G3E family GTPase|uniref:CobW family GTP-binding protein n=1 Tax=Lacrimispora sphenoides TaxID=29370 RepID=UPI0008CF57B0|nr:CobW family GTP-binding protein [Lacrimispora sphenoides]SEU33257.1 Cobalamin synthesis protein cobW C-terminal domain-containing protein [Lacrimispora sphenoides]
MTKIDIISGFLGAGKTTFIKKLLQEAIAGEQVVLIENEFGEIGIDGGFLKDAGVEIREMNSGCICCSLVGDFGKSLEEVLTKYHPDRVIIEPSGVGKLSDVMKAVIDVASDVEVTLNSAVTIVDAQKCRMYRKNFGEFFNNQIENAGTIVLSRTDIAPADKVEQALQIIRELNPKASVVTTPCDELSGKQLLEIIEKPDTMAEDLMEELKEHRHHQEEGCGCGGHHHDHEESECGCGGHHHDHEESECGCGGHHHDHEESECGCGGHHHDHHHEHGEECGCGGHHHDHEESECGCGGHHHDHEESECGCGGHHHDHHHEHGEECGCGHDHDHHADEVFSSWGLENVAPMSKEELDKILDELAYGDSFGDVLRAKGMIPGEEKGAWHYFDLVPEQYEIRNGAPEYTGKVCVIGANLKEEELKKSFER